jgi:hypothetical protein
MKKTANTGKCFHPKESSTMTASKFLSALFLIMGLMGQSSGFAELSTSFRKFRTTNKSQRTMATSTSLPVFTMPDDLDVLHSPLLRTTMSSLQLIIMTPTSSSSALLDPNMEAEVFTDMSHLALDFTSVMNSSKALLKMTSVIGRMLVILADYIPDHSIHPEELVFQLFMLGVAIKNLATTSMESQTDIGEPP